MNGLEILYEDNHLLVVNKPVGIATMGAEEGPTMHSLAANYLRTTYHKPGNVYVGIVSRLDAMSSGVLVLARTSKAAARLSAQFAERSSADETHPGFGTLQGHGARQGCEKIYLAVLQGEVPAARTELIDYVRKDDAAHRMRVVSPSLTGAQQAILRYHRLASKHQMSLVAVRLISGRKHQIRLQFSHRGHPIVGDRKYGASNANASIVLDAGIALHSWRLRIIHPTQRVPMWFQADPPAAWTPLLSRLNLGRLDGLRAEIERNLQLRVDHEP